MMSKTLVLACAFSRVLCWTDEQLEDGLSLIQLRTTALSGGHHHTQAGILVPALHNSIRFVGRYDKIQRGGGEVVRFDAAGFEVQFRTHGASEVKILLEQKISGPAGYYSPGGAEGHWGNKYVDGCMEDISTASFAADVADVNEAMSENVRMEDAGSQPHHFLTYIDGVPQREPVAGSKCQVCTFDTTAAKGGLVMEYTVATGLDPSKPHDIRIVKASEPDFATTPGPLPNWLAFHGLNLDAGRVLMPERPRRARKIEVLGDSVTSGYCNTCNGSTCPATALFKNSAMRGTAVDTYRWGSFALAWPYLICEELEAECHATVLSGMGMDCNTHPDEPYDCVNDINLPDFWERTLASDSTTQWDFRQWQPDVFVIQASQNDHPEKEYAYLWPSVAARYEKMIDSAVAVYPGVTIVFVCGPFTPWDRHWTPPDRCFNLEVMAKNRRARGFKVYNWVVQDESMRLFSQSNPQVFDECCNHPNEPYHAYVGRRGAEKLKTIMGW